MGSALESMGKYPEAAAWYQKYAAAFPNDSRAAYKLQGIERLSTYYEDSTLFDIKLLNINTALYDFAPAFFQQGIAFVSARENYRSVSRNFQWDNTPFLDIYFAAEYRPGQFQVPVLFNSKINSTMHEGSMAFNADYTRIVFTRNNYFERKKGSSEEGVNKLKMYFAERTKEDEPSAWTNLREFPYNSDQYAVGDPAVNKAFTRMIFASDMPGGRGGTDLYSSVFENGAWSAPENLGEAFNTEGNERSPFLLEDGRIFFASDGRDGLGGLDIYVATPGEQGYTVKNMGYPINSRLDDFGLILDTKTQTGYFASNRPGGAGMDDIYAFTIHEKPVPDHRAEVCFEVKDKDTEAVLGNATIYMMNQETKAVRSFTTDEKGYVCTELRADAPYLVKASKAQYLADCMAIHTTDTLVGRQQPERPLLLEPMKVAQTFKYDEIYFDLNEYTIRPDAAAELDKIVAFIKAHPGISVELGAHTDSRNTNMYNEALSLKRAQSSVEYIISQGVDASIITAKGYGEYMLINHCDDGVPCLEDEHQQNRRTEIKITGIREADPEQAAKLASSQQGLDPVEDYSETCETVKLTQGTIRMVEK